MIGEQWLEIDWHAWNGVRTRVDLLTPRWREEAFPSRVNKLLRSAIQGRADEPTQFVIRDGVRIREPQSNRSLARFR